MDLLDLLEKQSCHNCEHTRERHDVYGCVSRVNLYGALVTCGCKNFRESSAEG